MTIRSMTGFAEMKGQRGPVAYTLSLKSVNHRFLDLHLRMPPNSNGLESKLRQIFKQRLHRGTYRDEPHRRAGRRRLARRQS